MRFTIEIDAAALRPGGVFRLTEMADVPALEPAESSRVPRGRKRQAVTKLLNRGSATIREGAELTGWKANAVLSEFYFVAKAQNGRLVRDTVDGEDRYSIDLTDY